MTKRRELGDVTVEIIYNMNELVDRSDNTVLVGLV